MLHAIDEWTKLFIQEYAEHYDTVAYEYVRTDNGAAMRKLVATLLKKTAVCQKSGRTGGGCFVHEVLKASEGRNKWESG